MRTATDHELDPLLPGFWELTLGALTLGVTVAFLVLVAVVLTRLMRH